MAWVKCRYAFSCSWFPCPASIFICNHTYHPDKYYVYPPLFFLWLADMLWWGQGWRRHMEDAHISKADLAADITGSIRVPILPSIIAPICFLKVLDAHINTSMLWIYFMMAHVSMYIPRARGSSRPATAHVCTIRGVRRTRRQGSS